MTAVEFRAAMRNLGITQRALAERLGLAISTVNRWAMGQAEVPQYAVAYLESRAENLRLARALSASLNLEMR